MSMKDFYCQFMVEIFYEEIRVWYIRLSNCNSHLSYSTRRLCFQTRINKQLCTMDRSGPELCKVGQT